MADETEFWTYSSRPNNGTHWQAAQGTSVPERPLDLFVNGRHLATIMRLPGLERELALGYCYDEGLVSDARAVQALSFTPGSPDEMAMVIDPSQIAAHALDDHPRMVMAVAGVVQLAGLERIELTWRLASEQLLAMPKAITAGQVQRRATGGTHAAGLFTADGDWQVVCEDIGRHNAVDKCVGATLLEGRDPGDMILVCTGRLSYEMVAKALRARIPVLATLAVPTALAVSLAQDYGLTLVSRLRPEGFEVHAHPERFRGWD